VFHLWLKIQPPFTPFVYPKPPVAASLRTATMVTLVGQECCFDSSSVNPFFLAAFFLCQYWFSALVT
jgi:hypothetical protein